MTQEDEFARIQPRTESSERLISGLGDQDGTACAMIDIMTTYHDYPYRQNWIGLSFQLLLDPDRLRFDRMLFASVPGDQTLPRRDRWLVRSLRY